MKVNANKLEESVAVPLSIVPRAIMIAPMPTTFLTPILSAMRPAGIATTAIIRIGATKSRLVWVWVRSSSSLRICSIGGTQNIAANMAKPSRKALPNIVQGRRELSLCCIVSSNIDKLTG